MTSSHTSIEAISNISSIYQELRKCDINTLFLIDVGGTLLILKDPVFHIAYDKWINNWFTKHYPNLTYQKKVSLIQAIEENPQNWFLGESWPDLLKEAQQKRIKTLAFTKALTDPSLENLRIKRLQYFGLIFQDELPELRGENTIFTYTHGVIQTEKKVKGPVLHEILKKVIKLPLKILFVDDRIEQIKSVEETCKEFGISFIGLHYIAFAKAPYLNEDIASKQLEILVKKQRWIPYKELSGDV